MALDSKKFEKLRKKVEKKLIGSYESSKGLGTDLIIKRYCYVQNDYGDPENIFVDQETTKGIIVASRDAEFESIPELNVVEGELLLYIPIEFEVEDTADDHYEFVLKGITYELVSKNDIGQVCNMPSGGVVRSIKLKPKS